MPHPQLRHRPRFPFQRPYAPPIVQYYTPTPHVITYVAPERDPPRQYYRPMMWFMLIAILLIVLALVLTR